MERKQQSNYLEFSKKERNGIIVCLLLIAFLIWLPSLYEIIFLPEIPAITHFQDSLIEIDSTLEKTNEKWYGQTKNNKLKVSYTTDKFSLKPFAFDPNTISLDGWLKMGLREKTAKTIINYTSKGGKFRKPEDLKKIWGISEEQAEQLIPYVNIQEQETHKTINHQNVLSSKQKLVQIVDINSCDSATLEQLPFIGSGFAKRIISYRQKLGGFHSLLQIAEVYGLPDSVFQKIKPHLMLSDKKIKKININKAQLEELKSHPYIRYRLANAIIQYRNQHGNFVEKEDLKKIMLIDNESYNKIMDYISLE